MSEKQFKEPMTKKRATQGKKVKVHKEFKGQIAMIMDKAVRRHILNMHLEMLATEDERKTMKNKTKLKELIEE